MKILLNLCETRSALEASQLDLRGKSNKEMCLGVFKTERIKLLAVAVLVTCKQSYKKLV